MAKARDPQGPRSASSPSSETGRTRLANWPPPYRARESKPVIMTHQPGEVATRAKPRGWRLTRAMFSEFADD